MMSYDTGWVTTSTSNPTFATTYFSLSNFYSYAEYTGLFDQYRFDELEIWIEPQLNASATAATSSWFSAVDFDDVAVPTIMGTVAAKQGAVGSNTGAGHYHRFIPHMAVAAYGGAFTQFANVPPDWIDSGSPNVQHYGIKSAFETEGVARPFRAIVRAKVSFRAPGI